MSTEEAQKHVSTMPRDREEPPATDAMSSLKDNGASETLAEPSVTVVGAKQSIETNVAQKANSAPEEKGQAKSAHPSGPASADNKAGDAPVIMKGSVEADVYENNNEVPKSSTKLVTNPKPSVACADSTADAKGIPSKEAAMAEAPKDVGKSEKAAESSKEHFLDPEPFVASVDNNVPPQKAISAPKEVASVQQGGDATAGTSKAGDTKAVLPAETKATSDELSPEKETKPDEKPPSVGVTENTARVEASWKDQTMEDFDEEKSSRTKRSAAKSTDSVAWKRKKVAAKSVLLASAGKSNASDWQASPASAWGTSPKDAAATANKKKKKTVKKTSPVGGIEKSQVEKKTTKEKKIKPKKEEKKQAKKGPKLSFAKEPKETPTKSMADSAERKAPSSGERKAPGSGSAAIEVWSGKPDEPLEGGWPDGWTKKVFERASGKTKGTRDGYWYTPVTKRKLRSMTEVKNFMAALLTSKGDEDAAWKLFKTKK